MSDNPVTGEVSNSKVAAVFSSARAARAASTAVADETGIEAAQIRVITPGDPDTDIKLEPEGGNIWRTLVVSHVRLGIAGLLAGLCVFGILMAMQLPQVVQSPFASAAACAFFGALGGLMLGGLVTLRPDHATVINATRDAADHGRTTVVVHALSAEQRARAMAVLGRCGGDVTQTL